jgi:hypothetical protein
MRLSWLIAAFFLSGALALLNSWALDNHIFWRFVWFDVFMHFLGGIALATLAVGLLRSRRPLSFAAFLTVAFIAWEVFEYVFGVPREANYQFDTALDILMDTLGAIVVYAVARISVWKA